MPIIGMMFGQAINDLSRPKQRGGLRAARHSHHIPNTWKNVSVSLLLRSFTHAHTHTSCLCFIFQVTRDFPCDTHSLQVWGRRFKDGGCDSAEGWSISEQSNVADTHFLIQGSFRSSTFEIYRQGNNSNNWPSYYISKYGGIQSREKCLVGDRKWFTIGY